MDFSHFWDCIDMAETHYCLWWDFQQFTCVQIPICEEHTSPDNVPRGRLAIWRTGHSLARLDAWCEPVKDVLEFCPHCFGRLFIPVCMRSQLCAWFLGCDCDRRGARMLVGGVTLLSQSACISSKNVWLRLCKFEDIGCKVVINNTELLLNYCQTAEGHCDAWTISEDVLN